MCIESLNRQRVTVPQTPAIMVTVLLAFIVRPWVAHGFTAREKVNRIGVALHYGQTQRIATLLDPNLDQALARDCCLREPRSPKTC